MTPTEAIKMLDDELRRHGESVVVLDVAAGVPVEPGITVRGFVRGYKPEQLVGDIRQGDRKVVLSPTGLGDVPVKGSKVRISGKLFNVEARPEETKLADVLVRVEVQVRG